MIPFRDKRGGNRSGPSFAGLAPTAASSGIPPHEHTGPTNGGTLPEEALRDGGLIVREGAAASLTNITAQTLTLTGQLTLPGSIEPLIGLNTFGFADGSGDGRALFPEDPDVTSTPHVMLVGTDLHPVTLTGQTGNIGATSLIGGINARAPRGLWLISVVHTCTTAGSAGTLATTIGWTDANGAQTAKPAADLDLSAQGYASGTLLIDKAGLATDITYATTITGGAGSPQYRLLIRATFLGGEEP